MPSLDLSAFLDDDTLTLKGVPSKAHPGGAAYSIPSPNALDGLRLQRLFPALMASGGDAAKAAAASGVEDDLAALCTDDDGQTISINEKLLGPAFQQMVDDGVSHDRMTRIVQTVTLYYGFGPEVAEAMIAAGEAAAPDNRQQRRAAAKNSPRKATSKLNPESGATKGQTRGPVSTPSSKTSAPVKAARKAG